jgi:hypothetical protein
MPFVVQRQRSPLGPVKQRGAEPPAAVRRVHAASVPHHVAGLLGAMRFKDAVSDHGRAVVDGDRSPMEVLLRIVEILAQVLLANCLVLMVDRLDGGEQVGPGVRLVRGQRPPVEFGM